MEKKYVLLKNETKTIEGITLFRIKAIRSFGSIKKGQKGGFIQSKKNLSYEGDAWVSGSAQVSGSALVSGNAQVHGNAQARGNAWVYGNALVYENAWVSGSAQVYGNAQVHGNAWVYENVQVYGNALVYENAWVYGNAWVYENVQVSGNAWVSGSALVSGNAQVHGNAQVRGNVNITKNVINLINVCPCNITMYNDQLQIGCHLHTFKEWEKIYETKEYRKEVGTNEEYKNCKEAYLFCKKLYNNNLAGSH